MNCIKEKCPFFVKHDFYDSYFKCTWSYSSRSFDVGSEIRCILEQERKRTEEHLRLLETAVEQVKENI